jgi:uncharacterized protein (DUF2062 family)
MFSRKSPRNRRQKIREAIWPSMGFRRTLSYYAHRLGRMPGSAYAIAMGAAMGVAISFTPFIGLHILLGVVVCFVMRASVVAMILGTLLAGNPWTFSFIWVGSYKLGYAMMGGGSIEIESIMEILEALSMAKLATDPIGFLQPMLPMLVGSVPLGLFFGTATFFIVRRFVRNYKRTHLQKRAGGGV